MYLLRILNGATARMRDGRGFNAPVKTVTSDDYTLFENLPGGISEFGSPNVEVHAVASEDEALKVMEAQAESLKASRAAHDAHRARVRAKLDAIKAKQSAAAKVQLEERAKHEAEEAASATEPARLAHITPAAKRGRRSSAEEQ